MGPPGEQEERFASYLDDLAQKENRAALAALRRGAGKSPGEAAEMHRYVAMWLPSSATQRQEEAYYLVAALFALHPTSWRRGEGDRAITNLGASFQLFRAKRDSGSIEKRFVALLNCHREDLPDHLRHAVALLKTEEAPVDWGQLLRDIKGWDWEGRPVQKAWAKAFWAGEFGVGSP